MLIGGNLRQVRLVAAKAAQGNIPSVAVRFSGPVKPRSQLPGQGSLAPLENYCAIPKGLFRLPEKARNSFRAFRFEHHPVHPTAPKEVLT